MISISAALGNWEEGEGGGGWKREGLEEGVSELKTGNRGWTGGLWPPDWSEDMQTCRFRRQHFFLLLQFVG